MYLRDISIFTEKEKKLQLTFNRQTWWIEHLFLDCLGNRYFSGSYKKVCIVVSIDTKTVEFTDLVDVIQIDVQFDVRGFLEKPKNEKKKLLADLLFTSLIKVAEYKQWELDPLIDAYNCCLKRNLENNWLRQDKFFRSPDRNHFAGVYCNYDIDSFTAEIIFLNKKKEEIKRIQIFRNKVYFLNEMGKMSWNGSNDTFHVYSKDGDKVWKASL